LLFIQQKLLFIQSPLPLFLDFALQTKNAAPPKAGLHSFSK
jgi:hypothetical protein